MLSPRYIAFPLSEKYILNFSQCRASISYIRKEMLLILREFEPQVSSTHPIVSLEATVYKRLNLHLTNLLQDHMPLNNINGVSTYIKLAYIGLYAFESEIRKRKKPEELAKLIYKLSAKFELNPEELNSKLMSSTNELIKKIMQNEFIDLPEIAELKGRKECAVVYDVGYQPLICLVKNLLGKLSLLQNLGDVLDCLLQLPPSDEKMISQKSFDNFIQSRNPFDYYQAQDDNDSSSQPLL